MARLLVMDDDLEFSFTFSQRLRELEHTVDVFSSASEAITSLQQTEYDLLITDLIVKKGNLPVPDGGVSLINWVRARDQIRGPKANLPIIVVTGASSRTGSTVFLDMAKRIGASTVLEKPVPDNELKAVLTQYLQ